VKNVLVTMAIGDYARWGEELTLPHIRAYAEKYGMDFVLVDQLRRHVSTYADHVWTMVEVYYELLEVYDRMLSVPVDTWVKPNARNILELPPGIFYGMDELPCDVSPENWHYGKGVWAYAHEMWPDEFGQKPLKREECPPHLYNTGPMLVDRYHRKLFKPPSREPGHGMMEMALVNFRLHKSGMQHADLRPSWFNAANMWFADQPVPDFLHCMWSHPNPKEEIVRAFMPRMGY